MIKNRKQLPLLFILFFLSLSLGNTVHADLQTTLLTPRDHDTDFPIISPDGDLIIYRAQPDGFDHYHLYAISPDGGDPIHLTASLIDAEVQYDYQFTPDGNRIIFRAHQERPFDNTNLFSVEPDGSKLVQLSNIIGAGHRIRDFKISADSRLVVYSGDQDDEGVTELFAVPADGTAQPYKLSRGDNTGSQEIFGYAINPDSKDVTFRVSDSDNDPIELFSVPLDGGVPTRISAPLPPDGDVYHFQFTPNGRSVVYQAAQTASPPYDLFAVSVLGGNVTPLGGELRDIVSLHSFQIGSDGEHVVFQTIDLDTNHQDLFSVKLDGEKLIQLDERLDERVIQYEITPNGRSVVYIGGSGFGNPYELFSIAIDGDERRQLSQGATNTIHVNQFELAENGETIVYRSSVGEEALYTVLLNGDKRQQLVAVSGSEAISDIALAPNSEMVFYEIRNNQTGQGVLHRQRLLDGQPEPIPFDYLPNESILYYLFAPDSSFVLFTTTLTLDGKKPIYLTQDDGQSGSGETPADGLQRLPADLTGVDPDGPFQFPVLSANGRFLAFHSDANNLVPNDTNGRYDAFLLDRETSAVERVSLTSTGEQLPNGICCESYAVSVSGDGRFVAFSSSDPATPDDNNDRTDIFVRDRQTDSLTRVSVTSSGEQANGHSMRPHLSADGRTVVFQSDASNLVPNDDNGITDLFAHDLETGRTVRLSQTSDGSSNGLSRLGQRGAISANGRFVVFESAASNLVPNDTNGRFDIFVHDRDADGNGIFDEPDGTTIIRVSLAHDGSQANGNALRPAISANGRFVVFDSIANNLIEGDTLGFEDIFIHDRDADSNGIFDEPDSTSIERVSVTSAGEEAEGGASREAMVSENGRFVTFSSGATNLAPVDFPSTFQLYRHDRNTEETVRISERDGIGSDSAAFAGVMTPNGSLIAFHSAATNLTAGDDNGQFDLFLFGAGTLVNPEPPQPPAGQHQLLLPIIHQ